MGDLLGNLIFVVLAILAWVVKEAVERKEQKQAQQQRGGSGPKPESDVSTSEEVDVVYGRRKIPEPLTAGPAPTAQKSSSAATPAKPERLVVPHTGGRLVSFSGHRLKTEIRETASAAAFDEGAGRYVAGSWARLGLTHPAARRNAARAGILWSEVLGPPRAHQGPHRSPVLKRMQRR